MEDVKTLYETTELTLQEIADKVGTTFSIVWYYVKQNYSIEQRKSRKRLSYQKSKQGNKNPMFGKFGNLHPGYKGEVSDGRGYLMVLKPEWYTGRKGSKHVFKHSLVMCEHLGLTEIPEGFCVHHIDGNKHNNDIDNLMFLSISAHTKLHSLERATTRRKP